MSYSKRCSTAKSERCYSVAAIRILLSLLTMLSVQAFAAPITSTYTATGAPFDYDVPFRTADGPVNAVFAKMPDAITQVVSGSVVQAVTIYDGAFANGKLKYNRPAVYAFFQNGQWWWQSLRPTVQAPIGVAVPFGGESQAVCSSYYPGVIVDWKVSENSLIQYKTAGDDGSCDTADDEYHTLRLSSATTQAPISTLPLRAFYNADGSIKSVLSNTDQRLVLYEPTLQFGPITLLDNLQYARSAGAYARTADAVYIRTLDLYGMYSIYKVTSDGAISPPILSTFNKIKLGFADSSALYSLVNAYQGSTSFVNVYRIPFDGSSGIRIIYTGSTSAYIYGVTEHAVIIGAYIGSSPPLSIVAIEKTTGASVTSLGQTNLDPYLEDPYCDVYQFIHREEGAVSCTSVALLTVSNNRIYWTAYGPDDINYIPVSVAAGISSDDGTLIEQHPNSMWVGAEQSTVQYNTAGNAPTDRVLLAEGYSGAFDVTGLQGASLISYDLNKGTQGQIGTVSLPGFLPIMFVDAVTAMPFLHAPTSGRSDIDMFVVDLAHGALTQLTDTPSVDEISP